MILGDCRPGAPFGHPPSSANVRFPLQLPAQVAFRPTPSFARFCWYPTQFVSLGQYPVTSLADARIKRDDAKKLLAEGIDPSVERNVGLQLLWIIRVRVRWPGARCESFGEDVNEISSAGTRGHRISVGDACFEACARAKHRSAVQAEIGGWQIHADAGVPKGCGLRPR